MDKTILVFMIIYSILGLVMILSASSVSAVLRYAVSPSYFFVRQLIFIVASFFVGIFFVLKIPTFRYRVLSLLYLAGVLGLLFLVFGYGFIAGGAQSWLDLGFFNLQPTEFAKTALILFMACFYEHSIKSKKPFMYNLIPIIIALLIYSLRCDYCAYKRSVDKIECRIKCFTAFIGNSDSCYILDFFSTSVFHLIIIIAASF